MLCTGAARPVVQLADARFRDTEQVLVGVGELLHDVPDPHRPLRQPQMGAQAP
jgi:hypothetical protein